jgi:hypothetical protein
MKQKHSDDFIIFISIYQENSLVGSQVALNISESGFKRMEILEASDDESEEHLYTNLKIMYS